MLGNNTVVFCRVIYICIDKVYEFMIVTLETNQPSTTIYQE